MEPTQANHLPSGSSVPKGRSHLPFRSLMVLLAVLVAAVCAVDGLTSPAQAMGASDDGGDASQQAVSPQFVSGAVTVQVLDQYGNGVYDTAEGATQVTLKLQNYDNGNWIDVAGDNATWTVASAGDATTGHQFTGLAASTHYRIVQVAVASGYRTANHTDTQSIEFAIGADGKTSSVNLNNGSATNGASGNDYLNVGEVGDTTFVLRSELEVGQAQFTKYDSTIVFDEYGSPTDKKKTLSGVSFDLYREANAGQVDLVNDKLVSTVPIVSDANGIVSTLTGTDASGEAVTNKLTGKPLNEGLEEGTYYFKEVATRSDFILSTNTTNAFTVARGSTTNYTWSDFSVNTLNTTSDYLMKNTPLNAAVTLTKVDADSLLTRIIAPTKVNGATYELRKYTSETAYEVIDTQVTSANGTSFKGTDSNGNTHSRTNTSDGQLWFVDVPAGSYKVVETVPAPGYELDATVYEVAVKQANAWTYENYTIETTPGSGTVSDVQNSLTITKAGIAGATATQLAGTSFSLVPEGTAKFADGTTDAVTWTTTKDDASKTIAGKLVADSTYRLSETVAPAGYLASEDVYLRMDAAGNLSRCATAGGTYVTVSNNELTITDEENSFTVAKAGVSGATAGQLAGTWFELRPIGNAQLAFGEDSVSWSTNKGSASYGVTGELVADGKSVYVLHEVRPPAGYKTAADIYLRMTPDGMLQTSANGLSAWTSVEGNDLTVTDAQAVFTFVSLDGTGAPRDGSTFSLTGVFAGDADSSTLTLLSGDASQTLTGRLVAGNTYVLEETAAAAGYVRMTDKVMLTCNADGTLALGEGTSSRVTLDATGTTLMVSDLLVGEGTQKTDGIDAGASPAVVPVPQTGDASDLGGMACTGMVGLALAGLGTFLDWRRRLEC